MSYTLSRKYRIFYPGLHSNFCIKNPSYNFIVLGNNDSIFPLKLKIYDPLPVSVVSLPESSLSSLLLTLF